MSDEIEVLVMAPMTDEVLRRIAGVDRRVRVSDGRGYFEAEYRESWPSQSVRRYVHERATRPSTREERDRLLAGAEVIVGSWPFPLDLRARSPRLRWFHQLNAGASNLLRGDLWRSEVLATTSRGYGNIRPMAEYVLASFLYFARGFHRTCRDRREHRFDFPAYRPILLEGKTVCVVGAGGIGQAVGRLCANAGMRVVGTRRRVEPDAPLPAGFAKLAGAEHLHSLLAESEFVAVCCQWTPETTGLIGRDAFEAMKPHTFLANIARGEIIDEEAMIAALDSGKLGGAALDVYIGEFEGEPGRRLWDDERVIITPHVSSLDDLNQHRGVQLFCENLHAYLDGRPLANLIDWSRGY